jgi:VWFA-related protein
VGFLRFSLLLTLLAVPMHAQLAPAPDAPPTAEQTPKTGPVGVENSGTSNPEAQNPQNQNVPTQNNAPTQNIQAQPPVATFQVRVNLVNLFFLAHAAHNKLVPNLTEANCSVYEDNVKQTLKGFTAQSDLPLTLGILLDTSLSQQRVLPTEQQAGAAFLLRVLRPSDEAFLISFDVDATMLADFTSSPGKLKQAMDSAQINSSSANYATGTVPSIGKLKGTVLYDAVYLAANDKLRQESGRKALILLTDGEDEGSEESLNSAIEAAQKANAIVYVLLIRDSGINGMSDDYGLSPMRKLAQATGGQVFQIGGNGRKMQAAFEEIESELRTQYQVSYTPTNHATDGAYRRIRVDCQQNGNSLHVQARQGYYAVAH